MEKEKERATGEKWRKDGSVKESERGRRERKSETTINGKKEGGMEKERCEGKEWKKGR